jgi:hypothetical protein
LEEKKPFDHIRVMRFIVKEGPELIKKQGLDLMTTRDLCFLFLFFSWVVFICGIELKHGPNSNIQNN